jgi:hypothetical protein
MKQIILTTITILFATTIFGQTKTNNGFADFNEFKLNKPSLTFDFQLKQRSGGDIFMTGGISNYRLKKIKPVNEVGKVEEEIWGVIVGDSVYINAYPFSKVKGYNLIIEKGYYTYFIGEPARTEKEQRELGIIKPTEKQIMVCCQAGYVILPDGTTKLLRPELLLDLCKDNDDLAKEIKAANFKLEDVYKMFDILKKYNLTKK